MTIVALTLVAGYVGICLLLFTQQRAMMYPARSRTPTGPLGSNIPTEGPVVVHFHGNGESAADLGFLLETWKARGVGFTAVEYPGYAGTEGEPSERGLYEASQKALEALVASGVSKDRIVLIGQSLGTGPAVEMAKRGWGTKLVLITPFTSMGDVAQRAYPWLPAKWLVFDQYDSASKAPQVKQPVLVVHGTHDEVVPYALGRELSTRFPRAELVTVEGGCHNNLWGRANVIDRMTAFIEAR